MTKFCKKQQQPSSMPLIESKVSPHHNDYKKHLFEMEKKTNFNGSLSLWIATTYQIKSLFFVEWRTTFIYYDSLLSHVFSFAFDCYRILFYRF